MSRMLTSIFKRTPVYQLAFTNPQFPISFISMDLVGPYQVTEKGNQYALTAICMLTNYVFMIPIISQSTEEIIKVYLTAMYSTSGGSKYIPCDRGSEFTSKQFTFKLMN